MKAKIFISGQISGNFKLSRKMYNYTESENGQFNSIRLFYNTVKEAREDLKKAFKDLKENEGEKPSLSFDKKTLYFDASKAEILSLD